MGCTELSPPYLSNLRPFTLSLLSSSLDRGLLRIVLRISFCRSSQRFRFVFLAHHNYGVQLSDDGDEQVIAPFLIVIRVADRRALMSSKTVAGSGNLSSVHRGKFTNGSRTLPGVYPMDSIDIHGKTAGGLHVGVETTIDLHHDSV